MSALSDFSRSEKITGVAGVLLLIGIFAFPWYFVSIVALIVLIALLAELVISCFTTAQLPELPISWGAAELYAAIAVLALLVMKILFHIGNFGWGFYVNMLLAIVLVYGATGFWHSRTVRPVATPAPQHGN